MVSAFSSLYSVPVNVYIQRGGINKCQVDIFPPRVSSKWRRLLTKVFGTNHYAVDMAKLQQKVSFTGKELEELPRSLQASAEEWFSSQKSVSMKRNIFFYGKEKSCFLEISALDLCISYIQKPYQSLKLDNLSLFPMGIRLHRSVKLQ